MKRTQIVVILLVLATVGYLYSLPVKRLPKKEESSRPGEMASRANENHPVTNVTVDMASSTAKAAIGSALSAKISDLESQLKNASSDAEKISLQKQLAKQWDDVNQPAPAAFYYQDIAQKQNSFGDWLNAGNRFNDAYKFTQDTLVQPAYVQNAVSDFQQALKQKPNSLDAKTGLGIAYVNGGGTPMQGIALLLDVVKQDPNNSTANMNLGLFSMKSGQYEKAVQRFKTVIAQKGGSDKGALEPYFYLAESYKQLGMKNEAIAAYEKCKEMEPDPAFTQRIDQFIKELKD